jgi:hypothetical protein
MTALTTTGKGRYRHDRLGVEIEKTLTSEHPWELCGSDPDGSGVVLARTLSDARAFLREVEAHVDHPADGRTVGSADAALLALHRYLYPERYEDVPTHVWDAGTIVEVAGMIERALANHPDARVEAG